MTKPVLPACSVDGCANSAGAVVEGRLYCGEHASEALKRVIARRRSEDGEEKS